MSTGAPNDGPPVGDMSAAASAAVESDGAAPGAPSAGLPAAPAVATGGAPSAVDERPELAVGAAFAGGLILALVLKRLAG